MNVRYWLIVGLLGILGLISVVDGHTISAATPTANVARGDLNNDGQVDQADILLLKQNYGTTSASLDINGQNPIDILDLSILLSHYGQTQAGTVIPEGAAGNWSLTFSDEFEGSSIDLTKWRPNWLGGSNTQITNAVNTEETACFDPAQVSVSGGSLILSATKRSCTSASGKQYDYASGLIESYDHYRFTYGFMEARIWIPPGSGQSENWPAFWADGTGEWPSTGELDVMEVLEHRLCYHFHSPTGGPGNCPAGLSSQTGWHTFGANWQAGKVVFYYDGANVGQITSGITDAPMYLIANMSLSDTLGNPPSIAPSQMKVDYIRVWQ